MDLLTILLTGRKENGAEGLQAAQGEIYTK
jgi:hypothetical protein